MGSIICLFPAYSSSQILCFGLVFGIRVASKSNVFPYLFPSGILILLCEYQSFLIIEIVMSILFQPACFSSSGSDHFQHPQDQLKVFSTLFVSSVPSCLCFPAFPPFFFKDPDFLIEYPFFKVKFLHSFLQCSYPMISHENAQQFQVHHPSLLFLLRWIQFKLCWSYPFLVSNVFSCRCIS